MYFALERVKKWAWGGGTINKKILTYLLKNASSIVTDLAVARYCRDKLPLVNVNKNLFLI